MKALRSSIIFIVITVLGILLIIMSVRDKKELEKPPADIATMTEDDFYDGRFVEGDVKEIWTEFATMQKSDSIFGFSHNTKTTGHYFAMPLETSFATGEPKFVALVVRDSSDYAAAAKMEQESLDFYNNGIKLETVMHIKGRVSKLKGEAKDIFDGYIEKQNLTASTASVHYVINVGNDGSGITTALYIGIGIAAVGVIGTLLCVIFGRARG